MKRFVYLNFPALTDLGLLFARFGLGVMFILHGWPKLTGGVEKWTKLGEAMQAFGIDFAPAFWGFMAMFAELVGGALLFVGLLTRPALALLVITMVVAAAKHMIVQEQPFNKWSHAVEAAITFCALFLMGPGRLSLDYHFFGSADEDDAPRPS